LHNLIDLIRKFNPNIHFLMSISPVRHLKDGFVENQLSKAHLIAALHQLKDPINYFPSYEIMLDDLRDYRFYKEDFVHPNHLAINYIWDYFKQVLIKPSEINDLKKIEKIQRGLHHKSFNPDLPQERQRLQKLQKEIEILQKQYPWMVFL
ncbi:MAG TPA: GSCFA domain-containing protein, partial [Flavobacteriia bacterium]|nr:GSCFA domain-containing protein [Flavobacteriia bacterium]